MEEGKNGRKENEMDCRDSTEKVNYILGGKRNEKKFGKLKCQERMQETMKGSEANPVF